MDNALAVDTFAADDVLLMFAAAIQAPGVEGAVLGLPVLLWGPPGVGKTSRTGKVARALGYGDPEVVLASIRTSADFLGIPVPGERMQVQTSEGLKEAPVLRFAPPDWAIRVTNDSDNDPCTAGTRRRLVFFDEFTTASKTVQAAMLRIIHERVVGDFELSRNVVVAAAANPPAMSPGGTALSEPTANRFIHLYWPPPTPSQWGEWLIGTEACPATRKGSGRAQRWPKLDLQKFAAQYRLLSEAMNRWIVTAQGSKYLFRMPSKKDLGALKSYYDKNPASAKGEVGGQPTLFTDQFAWPSPRSLEIAVRARAAVLALEDIPGTLDAARRMDLADQIVCATIGSEACTHFNLFMQSQGTRYIPAAAFVADPSGRLGFLKRASDEDARMELDMIQAWFRELPLAAMRAQAKDTKVAIESFLNSALSAASSKTVALGFASWLSAPEGGQAVLRTRPAADKELTGKILAALGGMLDRLAEAKEAQARGVV